MLRRLSLLLFLLLPCSPLCAQTVYVWDGGAGTGNWFDSNNWNPNTSILTINADLTGVLRFDGTLAALPASSGLPGSSQIRANQVIFTGAFNPAQNADLVLGNGASSADLFLHGTAPRWIVDNGIVSTTQSTGSEIRLLADAEFAINGELRINGAILNGTTTQRGLTKSGTGTLRLRQANDFGGNAKTFNLVDGTLDITNDNQLGATGTKLVFGRADDLTAAPRLRVDAGGGALTIPRAISVAGPSGFHFEIVNTGSTGVTILDGIDPVDFLPAPVMRKSGDGTLTLAGLNTLGVIAMLDGRLRVDTPNLGGGDTTMLSFSPGSDAVFSSNGREVLLRGLDGASAPTSIIENSAGTDSRIVLHAQEYLTYNGVVRDGGVGRLGFAMHGGLTVGPTLAGNNTFNGDIDVHSALFVRHANALGSTSGFTRINPDGRLVLDNVRVAEPIRLAGGLVQTTVSADTGLSGPILLEGDSRIASTGAYLHIAGPIDLDTYRLSLQGDYIYLESTQGHYAPGAAIDIEADAVEIWDTSALHDADVAPPIKVFDQSALVLAGPDGQPPLTNAVELNGMGNAYRALHAGQTPANLGATRVLNGAVHLASDAVIGGQNGTTIVINGNVSGPGALIKNDYTALVLNGSNTYGGGTRIDNGELRVAQSLDANGTVMVLGPGCCSRSPAGTPIGVLSGGGMVGPIELLGGVIAPGNGVGMLAATSLQVTDQGGVVGFQLGANAADPLHNDLLQLGSIVIDPAVRLAFQFSDGDALPTGGQIYTLIETTAPHGLTAGRFQIAGYSGALTDFGGRFRVTPTRVQFEMVPGLLFADSFED